MKRLARIAAIATALALAGCYGHATPATGATTPATTTPATTSPSTTSPSTTPAATSPSTAPSTTTPATPAPSAAVDARALRSECTALIRQGRYADAARELANARPADLGEASGLAFLRATALLYLRDFAAAAHVFEALGARARQRDDETEAWTHNALTWVRWAEGNLDGALAENQLLSDHIQQAHVSADARRGVLLHYWWDRAYLLLDRAYATDPPQTSALHEAEEARRTYDRLAKLPDDHDGVAVLDAYFGYRTGHGAAARSAAATVDVAKDDDVQDLYVIALALEAGGDRAGAEAVRERIRRHPVEYPMKPIILQAMARDAATR